MKNIKTILTITLLVLSNLLVNGQNSGSELKNFRFGLTVNPSLNWFKPEGKIISSDGLVAKMGGGLVFEFRLASVLSVQSGIQINSSGGKLTYNNGDLLNSPNSNSVSYYYNTLDDKIVEYDTTLSPTFNNHYQLNARSYSITYITIPLTFKMKTKEIGMFTYYGQFGLNNSFRWKAVADDDIQKISGNSLGTSDSKSKVVVTKDVSFYTAALNVGIGAELNLSGTTSLTFGINYLYGFTNSLKNNSSYLGRRANDANGANLYAQEPNQVQEMPQKVNANSVALTVGVLF